MNLLPLVQCGVCVAALLSAPPARSDCPDLALVLAIDASGSIDKAEHAIQMQGYAAAFASPEVHRAIRSAGKVSVAVVLWGDGTMPAQVIPFRRLDTIAETGAFGETLLSTPRRVTGNTGLGRGMAEAVALLETTAHCAMRRVIDVSGDGKESFSPHSWHNVPLAPVREKAASLGIIVNGLAITLDTPDLADYYREHLIVGPGAFVMAVAGFDDFAEAILRKLVREIAIPELASMDLPP